MKVVYAGQLLKGWVQLTLTKPKTIHNIYIDICGKVKVAWIVDQVNILPGVIWGKENCLNERLYLVDGIRDGLQFAPGTYNYEFEFTLPARLPTSMTSKNGSIKYIAKVVLDTALWRNKTFEEEFTVIRAIDLGYDPLFAQPMVLKRSEQMWSCSIPCFTGTITLIARLPYTGVIPQQNFNLQLHVINDSNTSVREMKAEVIKIITYTKVIEDCIPYLETMQEKVILSSQKCKVCDAFKENKLSIDIIIPSTTPDDHGVCNLIEVRHAICIKTRTSSFLQSFQKMYLPITIGTYPIRGIKTN